MEYKNLVVKEQIVKVVVKSGNGGAVWVPKDWLGEEVVVILPQRQAQNLREKIFKVLEPYLKNIVSVSIFGSHARQEQTKDSDIDVLVLTQEKIPKLETNDGKVQFISMSIDKFRDAIEKQPLVYYQIVREAVPLFNSSVVDEMRKIKIRKENFKDYIMETKDHLKSNLELVNLDKLDGDFLESSSVAYSTILRLRGLFIAKCILDNKTFSNKSFGKHLISKGLSKKEFEESYRVYRQIRDGQKTKTRLKIAVAEKILKIAQKELTFLEEQIYDK